MILSLNVGALIFTTAALSAFDLRVLRGYRGGAEGNRTPDLLIANEALYQLSYSPTKAWYILGFIILSTDELCALPPLEDHVAIDDTLDWLDRVLGRYASPS